MLECLKNIIGITQSESQCIIDGLDTNQLTFARKSESGLYLDNLEGGVHLKALKTVDTTRSMYDLAKSAIENATKIFEDDLIVSLNLRYEKNKAVFMADIGRRQYAQTLTNLGQYNGVRLKPIDYSDKVVTINKITGIFSGSASFMLKVYKVITGSATGELVGEYNMNVIANTYSDYTPEKPLKFPLMDQGEALEYWFIYDKDELGGVFPKDTKVKCGPCEAHKAVRLAQFVEADGVRFQDLSNLQRATKTTESFGLILDVVIKCENERLVCREYKADDALAVCTSHAIWYKAGELLIEYVNQSPDVNRFTTMGKEYLWGKRNHFRKSYEDRIKYLGAALDVTAGNCYYCREVENQPIKATIFS